LLLAACSGTGAGLRAPPALDARIDTARHIALNNAWTWATAVRGAHGLQTAWNSQAQGADVLTVYIEGDGLAWLTPTTTSTDPTPVNPVALKLAVRHDGPAAYLARPCQFGWQPQAQACSSIYWTSHRYGEEVLLWTGAGLDRLKRITGARALRLVGYSGGAAVALLLASRRADIDHVTTVAGLLDTVAWTRSMGLAPLAGSLNPADKWEVLARVPQVHWVGAKDRIVPPAVALQYVSRFPAAQRPVLRIRPGFDHHHGWEQHWQRLQAE
jgi:pimeloyl-ACP methyl ester carboxylesterase